MNPPAQQPKLTRKIFPQNLKFQTIKLDNINYHIGSQNLLTIKMRYLVLIIFLSFLHEKSFGTEICQTHSNELQKTSNKLNHIKEILISEISKNYRHYIFLKDLQDQIFYYKNTNSINESITQRNELALAHIIDTTKDSSKKLESLLKDIQWLEYINKHCQNIK